VCDVYSESLLEWVHKYGGSYLRDVTEEDLYTRTKLALNGKSLETVPESLGQLTALTILNLNNNKLQTGTRLLCEWSKCSDRG